MLYRKILKHALTMSWRNKYLWFFGLFAALFIDNSGFELFFQTAGGTDKGVLSGFKEFSQTGILSWDGLSNAGHLFVQEPLSAILSLLFLLLVVVLIAFLIWLAVVSQIAIVNNSAAIISKKNHDLKGGVLAGANKFLPAFGLNFLAFVVMVLPLLINFLNPTLLISKIFYFLLFTLLILLVLAFAFILKFAIAYLVIKNDPLNDSLKKGWNLFAKNWVISIEMAIILFLVGFLGYAAIKFILLPLLIMIVLFGSFLLYAALSFSTTLAFSAFWIFYVLGYLFSFLIVVFFGAFLTTFQISSWTRLFVELDGPGGESKISRITSALRDKIGK